MRRSSSSFTYVLLAFLILTLSCYRVGEDTTGGDSFESRAIQDRRMLSLLENERFEEALSVSDSLVSTGIRDSKILSQKAYALSAIGRMDESVPVYEEALMLDYQNGDIHLNFAVTLMRMGKIGRAITEFGIASRFSSPGGNPTIYRNLAVAHMKMNEKDKAMGYIEEGLDRFPDETYLNGLKAMLISDTRPIEAESLFVTLRKSGVANPHFLYQFGLMLMKSERWEEAVTVLRDVVESKRGDSEARLNLAESLIMSGRYAQAIQLLDEDRTGNLSDDATFKIARALQNMQKYREALELYNELNTTAKVMDRMGLCYFRLGMNEKAEEWARRAVDNRPEWPVSMINLAVILAGNGKLDEAALWLEKVLAIDPDNIEAKINLDRIEEARR